MKIKFLIITCFLMLLCFESFPNKTKLHFVRYNTSNGFSNNRVYSIIQDKQGFLWFGTLDGLNRFDGYAFTIYRNIPLDSLSLQNNRIIDIYQDIEGDLWLFTEKNGISCFNPETEKFRNYKFIEGANFNLFDITIDRFYENKGNELVFVSGTRQLVYKPQTDKIVYIGDTLPFKNKSQTGTNEIADAICKKYHFNATVTQVVNSFQYKWIATQRHGLFILSNDSKYCDIERYDFAPFDNAEVLCIFKDNSGIIWIGTKNEGLFKHNPLTSNFFHLNNFDKTSRESKEITIRAITDDATGNLWIGTYNEGLIRLNLKKNEYTYFKNEPDNPYSLPNNMVRTLYTDVNGDIWVGTYGGASKYDVHKEGFINYLPKYKNEVTTEADDSMHIYFARVYGYDNDHFGNLWIANWRGLSCFNPKTKTFKHYPSSLFNTNNIREVFVDKNNSIWIGSEFGGLIQFNSLTEEFVQYLPNEKQTSLAHQNVFAIFESTDDKIYVSTFNGLSVLNRSTGKFTQYNSSNGLAGNMIYGILEDKFENIWLTTTNGLSMLNPKTGQVTNYTEKIGLQSNEFTEGAYYKSPFTGKMIVGGINGINIFDPEHIVPDTIAPKVAITSLLLFNQPIGIDHPENIINKVINYTNSITLKHRHKVISFEFTGLHFAIPEELRYKYMLEGFDNDWAYTTPKRRYATYTNLKPGKYTFKVTAANTDNYWSEQPALLNITILPPWWQTWWAFLIYSVIVVFLMLIFRHYSIKSTKIKNALKLERIKREKSEEIHNLKLNFFTNISHEYRTPLSLIVEPLNDLFEKKPSTPLSDCMHHLKLIKNNTHKMMYLTNQIIDLRKFEMGKMELQVTCVQINDFLKQIITPYIGLAQYNSVTVKLNIPQEPLEIWIDCDKMEKIINNVLSNALKYTPTKSGLITVSLSKTNSFNHPDAVIVGKKPAEPFILITVEDNGVGIPKEFLDKIFHQFYRVESDMNLTVNGSGIGLALVKEMVEMHEGAIAVESIANLGSTFYILLPMGNKHFKNLQIATNPQTPYLSKYQHLLPVSEPQNNNPETYEESGERKKILVVEDNLDMRKYLVSLLEKNYYVIEAANGQEGIELAFLHMPDIIISDIMMPKRNGIDLCKVIKSDIRTSHILIILLTAKTSDEDQIEGFKCKADDYISKPFNKELLKLRIKNLIEVRHDLIKSLTEYKEPVKEANDTLNPLDREFISRINRVIEENLSNLNFNVEQLSHEIGMSRSNLHLKLKALANQSASDYIRTIRLQHAVNLLKEQKKNINEIAYEVGFNTPSYFIKCFKEKFGLTPKEYLKI